MKKILIFPKHKITFKILDTKLNFLLVFCEYSNIFWKKMKTSEIYLFWKAKFSALKILNSLQILSCISDTGIKKSGNEFSTILRCFPVFEEELHQFFLTYKKNLVVLTWIQRYLNNQNQTSVHL